MLSSLIFTSFQAVVLTPGCTLESPEQLLKKYQCRDLTLRVVNKISYGYVCIHAVFSGLDWGLKGQCQRGVP